MGRFRAAALLLALFAHATTGQATAEPPQVPAGGGTGEGGGAVLTSVTPARGGDFGGMRVVLRGANLPMFAREGVVYVAGSLQCSDLRVEEAGAAVSCTMPPCLHCTAVSVQLYSVAPPAAPRGSNVATFTYESECYAGVTPYLPTRFSAAENCTVCRELVTLATASAGDVTSHRGVREALRTVCGSRSMKAWGPVAAPHCRTDLSAACGILFHAAGDDLADAMWNAWDANAMYGRLPDVACAAVGRCAPLRSTL